MAPITDRGPDSSKLRPTWLTVLGRILLPVALLAIPLVGAAPNLAKAASSSRDSSQNPPQSSGCGAGGPNGKDCPGFVGRSGIGKRTESPMAANTSHGLYVQVVITATSTDPALLNLRYAMVATGRSVYYMYE